LKQIDGFIIRIGKLHMAALITRGLLSPGNPQYTSVVGTPPPLLKKKSASGLFFLYEN